jgi:ABC-type phosphate/phosphonate transport system substrate-binding protein
MSALVASTRMYNVAPSTTQAWTRLLEAVSARAGIPLAVIPHAFPAPLEELWSRPDLGCAFMCGWPLAQENLSVITPRPILAAPVPISEWSEDQPVYRSDFLVAADAPFNDIIETFGKRFAFNARTSHSGYNMPRAHLSQHAAHAPLFAELVGPLTTPRRCLEAVAEGRAELTAIDSYAMQLLRRYDPDFAARVRAIGHTARSPIPPLVASPTLPIIARNRLRQALLTLHEDSAGQPLLAALCLARFAPATARTYRATLLPAPLARANRYPELV